MLTIAQAAKQVSDRVQAAPGRDPDSTDCSPGEIESGDKAVRYILNGLVEDHDLAKVIDSLATAAVNTHAHASVMGSGDEQRGVILGALAQTLAWGLVMGRSDRS